MEMLFGVMPICVLTGQLDVMREVLAAESGISSAVKAEAERYLTVSYTHLDVYKRQV